MRLSNISIAQMDNAVEGCNKWSVTNSREFTTDHLHNIFIVFCLVQIIEVFKYFIISFIWSFVILNIVGVESVFLCLLCQRLVFVEWNQTTSKKTRKILILSLRVTLFNVLKLVAKLVKSTVPSHLKIEKYDW